MPNGFIVGLLDADVRPNHSWELGIVVAMALLGSLHHLVSHWNPLLGYYQFYDQGDNLGDL